MECRPAFFSRSAYGEVAAWTVISPWALSSDAIASGWAIDTVKWSSLPHWPGPNSFSAALHRNSACEEVFTEGTAIRSLSVRSRSDLSSGLRVISQMLEAHKADTALAPMLVRVRSQSRIVDGMPWPAK